MKKYCAFVVLLCVSISLQANSKIMNEHFLKSVSAFSKEKLVLLSQLLKLQEKIFLVEESLHKARLVDDERQVNELARRVRSLREEQAMLLEKIDKKSRDEVASCSAFLDVVLVTKGAKLCKLLSDEIDHKIQ